MSKPLLFLKEFLRAPSLVGSVMPSGAQLSRRMVEAADIHPNHTVVEIGPGTGPMTREIRAQHPDVPLLLVEPSAEMAAVLRETYPNARVVEDFAENLPALVEAWGHAAVDRVVSGLPWTMWSEEVITAGLDGVVSALRPDGVMVTFSYVHSQALMPGAKRFRALLGERFGRVERTETQWRNVPPALVFVCSEPRSRDDR